MAVCVRRHILAEKCCQVDRKSKNALTFAHRCCNIHLAAAMRRRVLQEARYVWLNQWDCGGRGHLKMESKEQEPVSLVDPAVENGDKRPEHSSLPFYSLFLGILGLSISVLVFAASIAEYAVHESRGPLSLAEPMRILLGTSSIFSFLAFVLGCFARARERHSVGRLPGERKSLMGTYLGCAGIVVLVCSFFPYLPPHLANLNIAVTGGRECEEHMNALLRGVAQYWLQDAERYLKDPNNAPAPEFPKRLSQLYPRYVTDLSVFVCDQCRAAVGDPSNIDAWTSYGYIAPDDTRIPLRRRESALPNLSLENNAADEYLRNLEYYDAFSVWSYASLEHRVVLYEKEPHHRFGRRNVLYLDGICILVSQLPKEITEMTDKPVPPPVESGTDIAPSLSVGTVNVQVRTSLGSVSFPPQAAASAINKTAASENPEPENAIAGSEPNTSSDSASIGVTEGLAKSDAGPPVASPNHNIPTVAEPATEPAVGTQDRKPLDISKGRKAADQGDAKAQYYLGLFYLVGNEVPKDGAEAVRWFTKAAEQGYADAQFSLGQEYSQGESVRKNVTEAAKWYRKAAKQGHAGYQGQSPITCVKMRRQRN